MAALAGRSLNRVVFEANGKVKSTDISIPSTDFKVGKMRVLRLGNTNSFSVSVQQTTGQRSYASKKTIPLKSHQFKLSVRPTKLTITFGYNKTALSVVEANETELKTMVELLNSINEGKFSERKEISSRLNQMVESSETLQQNGSLGNDENQPLNCNLQKNTIESVQSSEANQFLSTGPDHNHSPSRLESNTHLGVKRRSTPFLSRSLNSSYGPNYSSSLDSVKKPFTPPLQEKSPTSDISSVKSTSSFYGTDSPATHGRKTIGLPKNYRQKPQLSRDSNTFSFKASVKPVFASTEVQLTGFSNLGNTCYMNAILQSLLNINSFAQDLCNRKLLDKIPTNCLYKCTYGLLSCKKNNCQQDLQSLHLKKFKKTISQAATRFSGHLQHDAHEFLCQVLDQLKDDVNALQPKSESDSTSESPAKEEISNQCPVRRTFECGVMHTITCKGCGESLNKEEIHHVFSLDLPTMSDKNVSQVMKKLSIDKLIEDYFEEEELEYCCEECGCKEAVIAHTFSRLPRVLILHLKRYDFNTYTDKHAKKQNDIQINRFIDIGKLCNRKTTPPLDFKVEKVKLSPRIAKRPPSDSQSDDDFVSSTTPIVRRKLHQDFNTTTPRKKKVQIICGDTTDDERLTDNEKEVKNNTRNSTSKEVEQPPKSSELNFIDDFDDIDNTPLEIETPKSDKAVDVINMSEEQQIEWAKKESLKSTNSNTNHEQNHDVEYNKTECSSTCNNSSRKLSRQSDKTGINTGNIGCDTVDTAGGTALDLKGDTEDMDSGTGDIDGDIGHNMDVDMDCSDEDLLTAYNDTHQQDNTNRDEETRDSEVHGLKGGARIGDAKVSTPIRPVTYISDDSDHSGLDTKKKSSNSSTKTHLVNSSESSDTSFDEGGGIKRHSKDNSLCSLMDRRPVLSKFSGDLLIESDSNEKTSRNTSRNSFSEKKFIKSVASPFNAKFQPPFKGGRSDSPSKQSVKRSPSSHFNRSSQTASKHTKNYGRTEVRDNRPPKKDVVKPDFDKEEVAKAIQRSLNDQVPSSDEEQVRKAIELSIQESRMDYSYDQQDDSNDERVHNVHQTGKTLSPHRDFQNNSTDSGYQGDEDAVSYPYRLVSVVSHLGDKSFAGHYISDVYDCTKDEWTSYDDLTATKVDEHRVRYGRSREGYIFFYLHKQCVEAVKGQSPDTRKSKK